MHIQPKIHNVKSVRISVLVSLLTFSLFTSSTLIAAVGDNLSLSPRPDPINWITGPAKADLGTYGEIQVPAGFRFAGNDDARTLLKLMDNPVPSALTGILAPISGKYMVVLEYTRVGYVKNSNHDRLDPKAILSSLRKKVDSQNAEAAKQGNVSIASVDWEMEPQHDRAAHVMEWAIRAQTGTDRAINHVVRVFGREGVIDGIAVQSGRSTEVIPLKTLMSGVSFKAGYTYADYREGDKVSNLTLAQLITADDSSEAVPADSHLMAYSIGGATVLILGVAGVVLLKRKPRHQPPPQSHTKPAAAAQSNGSAHAVLKTAISSRESHVNGHANGNGHLNGHANGKLNGRHKSARKRVFDYQKYYSDLMFQVSDRAYEVDSLKTERKSAPAPKPLNSPEPSYSAHSANLSLIEGQKRLIEEQQRLIREQSKLIEEKTRLIQEKNNVLDKQSELFGNNIF
jgi:uncharacterized membrane-anchored protein